MKYVINTFRYIISSKSKMFLAFWIGISLVYLPSFHSGYVAEFINYLQSYLKDKPIGFLNREDAYVKSLYQVVQAQRYVFFSLFWVNPYFWFLFFTVIHALNGTLVFSFFSRLFETFRLPQARWVAFAGTLLFLFSPNITEVTIWKACEHYLTSVMMQMLIANWVLSYLLSSNNKFALWSALLFAVSIFTLEIFYVTPFITLFLILGYYLSGKSDLITFKKNLFKLYLPQLILFFAHLIIFRIAYGTWVAHYGTTNEFVWSVNDIIAGYWKYFAYIVFNVGHFPYDFRLPIYEWIKKPQISYSLIVVVLFGIFWGIIRFKKITASKKVLTFIAGILLCCLTLVVTTYFHDLFSLYNSRRCYEVGIFMYMAIAVFIFSFRITRFSSTVLVVYFLINFLLLEKMIFRWKNASDIQKSIVNDFQWKKNNPVLLLNIPTYYKDVRIMSANTENEFNTQSQIWCGDSIKGKLYEVASFNMQSVWDGAHITVIDSAQIRVTLNQWGCWWMYNYLGANNNENELYKFENVDQGHEYLLKFKECPKDMAILYFSHKKWNKVNLNQKGEQW